ncbi:hypothetical protein D3C84_755180 [compost metagenome]
MIGDGVIDGGRGQNRVELSPPRGRIVLGEDGIDDGTLGQSFTKLGQILSIGLVVVDVKAQDVTVFNRMGDGVFVQGLLEEVLRGLECLGFTADLLDAGVVLENRRAGEAKKLGLGEESLDGLMVLAELRTMAFVEDEDDTFFAQRFELFGIRSKPTLFAVFVTFAALVQRQAKLLNGADDDLVGCVVRKHTADELAGVGVALDAAFLETVKFLTGLPVEVFAINHEQALFNARIGLEQGGGLEAG